MPNLRGASLVGRDDGDRSYVAQMGSSGEPRGQRRNCGEVLRTAMITTIRQ